MTTATAVPEVELAGFERDGFPRRPRSNGPYRRLLVAAPAIHDIYLLRRATDCEAACAAVPPLRAQACSAVIPNSPYEVLCSGSHAADREPYPTVMSRGPDHTQKRNKPGVRVNRYAEWRWAVASGVQRARAAPYPAEAHESRAFPVAYVSAGKERRICCYKRCEASQHIQACVPIPALLKSPNIGGYSSLKLEAARSSATCARDWLPVLNRYRAPSHARSAVELLVTAVPFILLWIGAWACLGWSYWLSLAMSVPAAGFLVRLFMIQHDCGHGAFFRLRQANDWTGRIIGVLTLTPYDYWRRSHAVHHASSGNLDRRGIGDVATLTVGEYLAASRLRRVAYRLYRHPLVMFGLGPAFLFLVQHRYPAGAALKCWRSWLSSMATNAAIAATVAAGMWLAGVRPFLLVHVPITLLAASIGVWLFYVQHQFEETFWAKGSAWTMPDAALHGSSHYDLPPVLRWLTANIGVHHVHHLCSRIPYYRLGQVLRDHPGLKDVGRITLLQSIGCVRFALWDEARRRMISFRQLRSLQQRTVAPNDRG